MSPKKSYTSSFIIILILLLPITIIGCSNQTTPSTSQKTNQTVEASNAFKLASLEIGYNDPDQSLQNKFTDILEKLKKKCPNESEDEIADYIYKTKTMIDEKGGQISVLESAKAIDESMPEEAAGSVSCAETAAAFITLQTSN